MRGKRQWSRGPGDGSVGKGSCCLARGLHLIPHVGRRKLIPGGFLDFSTPVSIPSPHSVLPLPFLFPHPINIKKSCRVCDLLSSLAQRGSLE